MPDTVSSDGSSGFPQSPEVMLGSASGGIKDVTWPGEQASPFGPLERHPGDTELALQTMVVQTPDEPITINGSSYKIIINEARLAGAVNREIRTRLSPGHLEPRSLTISLGEEPLPLKIADSPDEASRPVHDFENNGLHIEAPKAITNGSHSPVELARRIEASLNRDLEVGILENRVLKNRLGTRKFLLSASAMGMAAVGEGVGVATSNGSVGELLTRGTGGALLGALAVGVLTIGKYSYNIRRFETNVTPTIRRKSYRRARAMRDEEKDRCRPSHFHEPIILLVNADHAEELH